MPGSISDYSELQTAIGNWLLRSDLTAIIPDFISNFESKARRDPRIKRLLTIDLTVDAVEKTLPADYKSPEAIFHDGPTFWGELNVVPPGELSQFDAVTGGAGGPPQAVAAVDDSTLRFAPPPDGEYDLRFSYWQTVVRLSDTNLSNWLLDDHQDIYLYGALIESAPYLKDDSRIVLWEQQLLRRIDELDLHNNQKRFGGRLVRRVRRPIP